ncbi:hypothetical protein B4U80_09916 [Leptotrombidium deliense]|uniref:Fibronectin type-III domain-containing protein n=1 Tax=Leptotrombidium deliense TaxID=299467 RepID=A0A443SBQ2_9ACAR|nr:hypothetical protein B4U80_09916 [Leptotrombidium deliense]
MKTIITLTIVIISLLTLDCLIQNTEDTVNHLVNYCSVPRYAPYIYIKNVTSSAIILGVTDPNDPGQVTAYAVHYWGYRSGKEPAVLPEDRNFGKSVFSPVGPYVIDGLKSGFVYCADVTAINNCGHGPFCVACFENVTTLS